MTKTDWQKQLKQLGKESIQRQKEQELIESERQKQAEENISFTQAVGSVTPLKRSNRLETKTDKSPIIPRKQQEERDTSNDVFIGENMLDDAPPSKYANGGGGQNDIRKLLSMSEDDIFCTLDLHGYKQEEAQQVLNEFIAYIQKNRKTTGEIIHGSGLGSKGFVPKLKHLVRRWLMANPEVLAYAECPRNDGAVRILIKRKRYEEI
ncbi:MAG: Smr/MutS family protein [Neisseriaceae bacterium]|nr:Smr/MutS family protein [Neisseriaceae bacterium]